MRSKMYIIFLLLSFNFLYGMNIQLQFKDLNTAKHDQDYTLNMTPQEPKIPIYYYRVLLPMGEKLHSIKIEDAQQKKISLTDNFSWNKGYYPLSMKDQIVEKKRIKKNQFYPAKRLDILGEQTQNGYRILYLQINPFQWNPVTKIVNKLDQISIDIQTIADRSIYLEQEKMCVKPIDFSSIHHTEAIASYPSNIKRESETMLIISSRNLQDKITEYAIWRNEYGIETTLSFVEDIYENTEGINEQDKIRNHIKDQYQNLASSTAPLNYVLLAGDDEIIPDRGVHGKIDSTFVDLVYHIEVDDLPSDLYYAALDGTWDENNNGIYGEPDDNPDMIAEVSIGRIPVETEAEFQNYFTKVKNYIETSHYTDRFAYFIGEDMGWSLQTWGGDYMDELSPYLPEEHIIETRYDRDETFSPSEVIDAINSGNSFMNHMGHCNYNHLMGLGISQIRNLQNETFGFSYSQGCYPLAFDSRTSDISNNGAEAIGEYFITDEVGAFSMIGNTRYGWGQLGSTDGASQAYNHSFLQSMYSENERSLGKSLEFSRVDNIEEGMSIQVMRWVYYEMILFGDPSITLKTPEVNFPYISIHNFETNESFGENNDYDSILNPGENFSLDLTLYADENWSEASNVHIEIPSSEDYRVLKNEFTLATLPTGYEVETGDAIQLSFSDLLTEQVVTIPITLIANNGEKLFSKTEEIDIQVSLKQDEWHFPAIQNTKSSPLFLENKMFAFSFNGTIYDIDYNSIDFNSYNLEETVRIMHAPAIYKNTQNIVLNSFGTNSYVINSNGEILEDILLESVFGHPIICDINDDGIEDKIITTMLGEIIPLQGDLILNDYYLQLPENGVGKIAVQHQNDQDFLYIVQNNTLFKGKLELEPIMNASSPLLDIFIDSNQRVVVIRNNGFTILENDEISYTIPFLHVAESAILTRHNNIDCIVIQLDMGIEMYTLSGDLIQSEFIDYPLTTRLISADVDNDRFCETIAGTANGIVVFDETGSTHYPSIYTPSTDLAIRDLDGDNDFEIIYQSASGLYALDLKSKAGVTTPWTTFRGNYQRTANLADNQTITTFEPIPGKNFILQQSYPNPFEISRTLRSYVTFPFEISNAGEVKLDIYNIRGQKVKMLQKSNLIPGTHKVIWDGKDDSDQDVSSGIYFIKMRYDDKNIVKKFTIMK